MKNNLSDLNDQLFAMLETLANDEELEDTKKLEQTLKRASAMTKISGQIIKIANVQVSALNTAERCGLLNNEMPALIATKDSKAEKQLGEQTKKKLLEGLA